ncbi:endonuclease/exonuclease/phosphatase family protein [uncultured Algimonas sp.]|uniref:endonuclease/exonuclease/phosphatase family protein n=1 Tax=uncultured Algimonas sp. TaxID=1547920 RepID=UPI00260A1B0C|nr:endonuclease/exonuclease/phosphatase family protein [uncultured Algimonas sp.]
MSQTFSILSYNIQAGIGTQRAHHYVTRAHHQLMSTKAKKQRLRAIGKFLAAYDVVCLQEVDPGGRRAGFENQGELLRDASRHPHHVFQENRAVRAISRHGNAILSRVPIVSCEDLKLPGRIGGRGALVVELDMEPATVVACVHLSLGPEDQTEQLDFLADHLNLPRYGRARSIVCGDLNCTARSAPLSRFSTMTGLRPITVGPHKTFPSWAPRLGLDHILTDDMSHDHDVSVEDADYSDHRPVSAEFRASVLRS